jgi:hypothetical protein
MRAGCVMESGRKIIKSDEAYQINYSEKLIELRKQFIDYAKINLPFEHTKSFMFALNKIISQAIEDGASQGFDKGYAEALNDTWTLEQDGDLVRLDEQTFSSATEKIMLVVCD